MGAKTAADFLRAGRISPEEGRFLLAVAGCPSPMFLAGYVRSHLDPSFPFSRILLALYLPIPLLAAAAARFYHIKGRKRRCPGIPGLPPCAEGPAACPRPEISGLSPCAEGPAACPRPEIPGHSPHPEDSSGTSFDDLLMDSLEIMVKIGGYIMLYSILAAFLEAGPEFSPFAAPGGLLAMISRAFPARISEAFPSPALPGTADFFRPVLLGFVEMTTGIEAISKSMRGVPAAAAMAASAAFGGLSGAAQTNTVTKNAGLSIRHYVLWKLIHASLACAILILLSSR